MRDLLPHREWYLKGTHPGTDTWRHARTPLTPAFPRWGGEGMICPVCKDGRLTTYKTEMTDSGITMPEQCCEFDITVGYSICSTCYAQQVISVSEIEMCNVVQIKNPAKKSS